MSTDLIPTPDYSALIPAVLTAVESANTKAVYGSALKRFFAWYAETAPPDGFSRATIMQYRDHLLSLHLSSSTINLQLSAIKKLADEASANGWLDAVSAYNISKVKGLPIRKTRTGRWLTIEDAKKLLSAPHSDTLTGLRDRALLWLLLGCGLRISEALAVTVEQIEERQGRIILRDVVGKGNRVRVVPVPANGYAALYEYLTRAGIDEGRILRNVVFRVSTGESIDGNRMTRSAATQRVYACAKAAGIKISCHDLRRTFGGLAKRGGAPVSEIQRSYGHASSDTTDRYLGDVIDLEVAPCDLTGL